MSDRDDAFTRENGNFLETNEMCMRGTILGGKIRL